VTGDEPIVVTEHRIQTAHGALPYEARAGRLPIRSEQTGEIRGFIFFVAYVVTASGPRRRTKAGMVDNPETLLADSDLVFYDALETGFSRPAAPEYAPEFLNTQGDVAVTAEFIRAYRARFRAIGQPLWRIC